MRTDPAYRKITADEFFAMDLGTDKKFELVDGMIVSMAGGSEPHARVQGNIFFWLRGKLRGTGCLPYGPDYAIRVSETDIRYPDVSIRCGDLPDETSQGIADPIAVIEVLSPSTASIDQGSKLAEYKALPSVRTIAFVDPIAGLCRTVERLEDSWLDHIFSAERGLPIPALNLIIPHEEIFARD